MLKEKAERIFRRIRRNLRPALLLWLPAGIVVLFIGMICFAVAFSTDTSFHACSRQLSECAGENPELYPLLKCSYKTAWCDVNVVWNKMNGTAVVSDLPGLPPVDEKADKELFEKLTSDEFMEKRFQEIEQEEKEALSKEDNLSEKEDLKGYMEELRAKRIQFEKEMAEKREQIIKEQSSENNLSGQTEK